MADPLESARTKLKRANVHTQTIHREQTRFFNAHDQPTFGAEADGEAYATADGIETRIKVTMVSTYPPISPMFACRCADAIHNLRCALDHVAWQLAEHGTTPPATLMDWDQRRIQFPCYNEEKTFVERIAKCLPGVDSTAIDFIKATYAYQGGETTNAALAGLAYFSNEDKHRQLRLAFGIPTGVEQSHEYVNCEFVRFESAPLPNDLNAETVVGHLVVKHTGPNPRVDVKLRPRMSIVLDGGWPMLRLLDRLSDEVKTILDAPEISAALS